MGREVPTLTQSGKASLALTGQTRCYMPDVPVQELAEVRHHLGHGGWAGEAALQMWGGKWAQRGSERRVQQCLSVHATRGSPPLPARTPAEGSRSTPTLASAGVCA
jgi:hypothetical protein